MLYSVNNLDYKFVEENDGWWSIYRRNAYTDEYKPLIQAKTLEKAKEYCHFIEPVTVPLKEFIV